SGREGGGRCGGGDARGVSREAPALGRGRARRRGGRCAAGCGLRGAGHPHRPRTVTGLEGDAMSLSFGVHIPTCIEGMMYPIPFARPSDILPTALLCERLGYDSVWGNDHMTTQRYVQREFPQPPNFYEPLITFPYVAAHTTRLRLCTGSLVLPMRHMGVPATRAGTPAQLVA